jgi:putative intracellular protease/amidase
MAKVLILAGDAAEDLETMYVKYRLSEAGHEPHVSAPTTRPIKLVVHDFEDGFDTYVERPGRACPVDVAFSSVDPTDYAALVVPGGRAPEFIRVDPDVRRIVEHFFAEDKPVGTLCHGPQVPAALVLLLRAARPRHRARRRGVRRRCCGRRREHGLVPGLGRSRRVVARVSGVPRPRRGTRVGVTGWRNGQVRTGHQKRPKLSGPVCAPTAAPTR